MAATGAGRYRTGLTARACCGVDRFTPARRVTGGTREVGCSVLLVIAAGRCLALANRSVISVSVLEPSNIPSSAFSIICCRLGSAAKLARLIPNCKLKSSALKWSSRSRGFTSAGSADLSALRSSGGQLTWLSSGGNLLKGAPSACGRPLFVHCFARKKPDTGSACPLCATPNMPTCRYPSAARAAVAAAAAAAS